jgi:preprotein translocase subunit SecB
LTEIIVDFAAVGRVSSCVELKSIRLTDLSAKCNANVIGTLEPAVDQDCRVAGQESGVLGVQCTYRFTARVGETQVAEASIQYHLNYQLLGTEPLSQDDVAQFALSNGALHSWPFVREFLYDLTSRMGYPPYTLGLLHFKPKPQPQPKEVQSQPAPEKS